MFLVQLLRWKLMVRRCTPTTIEEAKIQVLDPPLCARSARPAAQSPNTIRRLGAARGIIIAVALSVLFWSVLGLVIWLG
jgi:hypothetical protein